MHKHLNSMTFLLFKLKKCTKLIKKAKVFRCADLIGHIFRDTKGLSHLAQNKNTRNKIK